MPTQEQVRKEKHDTHVAELKAQMDELDHLIDEAIKEKT